MEMRAIVAWQPAHDMMSPPIEGDFSLSKRIPKTSNDLTALCVLSKESSRNDSFREISQLIRDICDRM